jgi:type II restriction enzyme
LVPAGANTQAVDFHCPQCEQPFQLKSGRNWNTGKLLDAGYAAMMRAIREDRTPNLLVLQYSREWMIRNLLLIPKFFLSESVIEKRKALANTARRAGWIGCNILLHEIPRDGKIEIISENSVVLRDRVRERFDTVRRLADVEPRMRGWTLDVLRIIRKLGKGGFTLQELYKFEPELRELHPLNRNVKAKIRQQLQVLRDLSFIRFARPGQYSIVK